MKFRAQVTDFIGERDRPQVKRSSRQTIIALALDTRDDSRLVIVLKAENEKTPRRIQMKDIRSLHKAFLPEGKITLSLDSTTFQIKAQHTVLRRFVTTVNQYLKTGQLDKYVRLPSVYNLDLKMPKKDDDVICITSAAQLPSSEGYPRTVTCLTIQNVQLNEFDNRILRLQHISTLSLEGVGLKTIPNRLDLLPNLTTLNLPGNSLGLSFNWRWICCSTLQRNLHRLDLSNNQMSSLPIEVCRLSALKELALNNNQLRCIPNAIRLMRSLKTLLIKDNEIIYFPWHIKALNLKICDYSNSRGKINPEIAAMLMNRRSAHHEREVSSLVDLAATLIVNERLNYCEEEVPRHLCDYMDNAVACLCRRLVLPPTPNVIMHTDQRLADEIHYDANGFHYHLGYRMCSSSKCKKKCLGFPEQ